MGNDRSQVSMALLRYRLLGEEAVSYALKGPYALWKSCSVAPWILTRLLRGQLINVVLDGARDVAGYCLNIFVSVYILLRPQYQTRTEKHRKALGHWSTTKRGSVDSWARFIIRMGLFARATAFVPEADQQTQYCSMQRDCCRDWRIHLCRLTGRATVDDCRDSSYWKCSLSKSARSLKIAQFFIYRHGAHRAYENSVFSINRS